MIDIFIFGHLRSNNKFAIQTFLLENYGSISCKMLNSIIYDFGILYASFLKLLKRTGMTKISQIIPNNDDCLVMTCACPHLPA